MLAVNSWGVSFLHWNDVVIRSPSIFSRETRDGVSLSLGSDTATKCYTLYFSLVAYKLRNAGGCGSDEEVHIYPMMNTALKNITAVK